MKKEILNQFNELNQLVSQEVSDIADKLIECHDNFEDVINTVNDYYEGPFKLDDFIYSEIHKKMIKQVTNIK